ncbi:thioredoxin family protein [Xanthovirga aplysinae]|uniref:thioredoxin family protein n=1 Tax=Xanthovirga aplysinae TaxID=2529853 RepID=UPI0012BB7A24|nr:thioredoxin family protein [Xanthovirga aplysinae]MTI29565.1 thioredoxin family protein [Xanthovirga aplysinae]
MKKTFKFLCASLVFVIMSFNTSVEGYRLGDYVEDFSLKNIDGQMVSLADQNTQGYIVIFTCNSCPYAKMYEKRIQELDLKFAPLGFPVVAINPNDPMVKAEDSYENMQKRAKDMHYSFPYLLDDTQEVARKFGAKKTPEVYLLKKEGKRFKLVYKGAIDNNYKDGNKADKKYVEQAIMDLNSGRSLKYTTTKSIGCTIKWKPA